MAVNKPRRKYVGWRQVQLSRAGVDFIGLLSDFVADTNFEESPLAKVRDVHVFSVVTEAGAALVLQAESTKTDNESWREQTAFRTWSEPHVDVVLTSERWSPWLAFDGDEVRAASRKQRNEWDQRTAELAVDADDLAVDQGKDGELLGVSADELGECWALLFESEQEPPKRIVGAADTNLGGDTVAEHAALQSRVLECLRTLTGETSLDWDQDGDVTARFGSTQLFVRVSPDPLVVRVYAPALVEVSESRAVFEELNLLNAATIFPKWFLSGRTILAAIHLFGSGLVEEHVVVACQQVAELADSLDKELQEKLGGRPFHGELKPVSSAPPPGYL